MPTLREQIIPRRKFLLLLSENLLIAGTHFLGNTLPILDPKGVDYGFGDPACWWLAARCVLLAILYQVSLSYNDLYDWKVAQNRSELTNRLLHAAGYSLLMLAFAVFVLPEPFEFPVADASWNWKLILLLAVSFVLIYLWRVAFHWFFYRWNFGERVLILGAGPQARYIATMMRENAFAGYECVGLVRTDQDPEPDPEEDAAAPPGERVVGHADELPQLAARRRVARVLVALEERRGTLPVTELLDCKMAGLVIEEKEAMYERIAGKVAVQSLRPSYLIFGDGFAKHPVAGAIKRVIDVVVSLLGLVLALPICLLTALLIKLDSKGPIFFTQERVGQDGQSFRLIKFRSMRTDAEAGGAVWAQKKDDRVTRIGRFLRVSRIDEIPQMVNVLAGQMSFVGPRPERPVFVEQLQQEIPYYPLRHTVKPGLTGWAQVNYPYGASVADAAEKLRYDLYYVKHMSPLFDLNIILRTVGVILFGKEPAEDGAPRFSILVADDLGDEGLEILQQAGDVTVRTGMDEAALREALAGQHALVVRSATKVTRGALEGADQLAVIGRAGIGVDNIDVPAATERGIVVMNTPDAGAVTTGEHAIALLVAMARRIPAADASMKSGAWDKKSFTGVELTGKTLGVVGLGNIGRVVATRGLGLGMRVIAYDPFVAAERAPQGVSMFELDELCAESDFVTIHVPKLPATEHLFDAARIARMKPGSRLVHAARGGIVDDTALLAALESGHLAGAALDVFETEPLPAEHPFRRMAQVVLTPHIGASTVEAKRNIALAMARQVVGALRDGVVLNGVNVPRIDPARADALGPFLRLTHDLAGFLRALTQGDVQSVRLTLQGPAVSDSAAPLLVSALPAALRDRTDKPITPVNAVALAEELGVRTHVDVSTLKADFANLVRVEFLLADGSRHHASGTVLGHRHGRLIDFDGTILDAIPEPPLLVTRHADRPGVLGAIGTELGRLGINVERMQLGDPPSGELPIGIWNLQKALNESELAAVLALEPVERAYSVH